MQNQRLLPGANLSSGKSRRIQRSNRDRRRAYSSELNKWVDRVMKEKGWAETRPLTGPEVDFMEAGAAKIRAKWFPHELPLDRWDI